MAKKLPGMVDMAMDNEEKAELITPSPQRYPYGLSISLCEKELSKLGIDPASLEINDMLHVHALASVKSVNCSKTDDGDNWRVELQICYMAGEDEDEENKEADRKPVTSRLYK